MPAYDGMPLLGGYADDDYDTYVKELCIHVARRDIPELVQKIADEPETLVDNVTDADQAKHEAQYGDKATPRGERQYYREQSALSSNFNRNRNIRSLQKYRDMLKEYNVKE